MMQLSLKVVKNIIRKIALENKLTNVTFRSIIPEEESKKLDENASKICDEFLVCRCWNVENLTIYAKNRPSVPTLLTLLKPHAIIRKKANKES